MTVRKTIQWECDLCHDTITTSEVGMMPNGWRIGNDNMTHICHDCRGQLERMGLIRVVSWATHVEPINGEYT
jgi:hypothetical protein